MSDQDPTPRHPKESPSSGQRRSPPSDSRRNHRTERRSTRRAARRRKRVARLSLVAGPVVVVIVVIVALLVFLGGPETISGAETTSTTVAAAPVEDGAGGILLVEQDEVIPVTLLLLPQEAGGLVLGMPGNTLLKTAGGFKTLSELHASDEEEALAMAVGEELGIQIEAVAWLQWSELRQALDGIGQVGSLPDELETTAEDALLVAENLAAALDADGKGGEAGAWDGVDIGGEADGFRTGVGLLGTSSSAAGLIAEVLPGKIVEGVGFTYFEPDFEQARALASGGAPLAEVTMEVQNGSGVVGIAQQVGEMLESLGFAMLPFRNAEGFPDVSTTRIIVAPDVESEAERVRSILGVGKVEQDEALAPGRLIVIVGKDFAPPVSGETESAQ
jgi:hypothetical protein